MSPRLRSPNPASPPPVNSTAPASVRWLPPAAMGLAKWLLLPAAGALVAMAVLPAAPAKPAADPGPAPTAGGLSASIRQPLPGDLGRQPSQTQAIAWDLDDPEPIYVEGAQTALRAFIRAPAQLQPGGHPLALLIHGTHGRFRVGDQGDRCPGPGGGRPPGAQEVVSARGLVWLAEELSRRGMVAVVIDASQMGCVYGQSGAYRRMELALGLLQRWRTWQAGGAGPLRPGLVQAADLERLVLLGHSTGADAAALLAATLADAPQDPQLPKPVVAALVLVAPPDAVQSQRLQVPTAIWLPGCDGDVGSAAGRQLFQRLSTGRGAVPLLLWTVPGAVHNAANDLWRDEVMDGGRRVCSPEAKLPLLLQRQLLGAAAGEWLEATVRQRPAPPWVMGRDAVPPLGGMRVQWQVAAMP